MNTDFKDKRVLITGGTKGMGAATLKLMLERGAQVATTARSASSSLPAGVHFIAADLRTRAGTDTVIEEALASLAGSIS